VNNITGHPVLIMPPGVKAMDLKAIVEYIYKGEIYVTREQLSDIVQVANLLKIKGTFSISEFFYIYYYYVLNNIMLSY